MYINSDKKIMANEDMKFWFTAFYRYFHMTQGPEVYLKSIEGLENVDFSNTTDMSSMFHNCRDLESLDISSLNTSKATNMSSMFAWLSVLTSLNLSSFDTSKVNDMSDMFRRCSTLSTLDMRNAEFPDIDGYKDMLNNVPSNINIIVKDSIARDFIQTRITTCPSTGTITIAN